MSMIRSRWAAVGAAVAVTLGAGGVSLTQAAIGTGDKPVYIALDAPCRVIDTRPGDNNIGPKNTPISAGETNAYEIQITGNSGNCTTNLAVPTDAVAVALNVTAIAPQAPTTGRSFFTVYPADANLPTTSNLNFLNGQAPVPNKVDVGLSPTGTIKIYNNEGTAHAAVDIFGYYIDHTHDDRYYTRAQVDAALDAIPNVTDVYTKTQVDEALATKANTTDVYTKAQVDAVTGPLATRIADLETAVAQLTNSAAAFASSSAVETTLTSADVVYQSVSLMPPTDGVVVVNSHAYLRRADDFQVSARCGISTTSAIDPNVYQLVTIPVSGLEDFENVSGTRGFDVTGGELFTVNLVCTSFGEGTATIGEPALTAIFAPD